MVSVVVASFNGERYLRETLESVFAQEYDSFEVVLVDDGSSDGTADIARSFPLRYVYQENAGLPAARNAGVALATGELIAFVDDDDLWPRTKLAVQANYLRDHHEVGCVLGRNEWIVEDGVEPPKLERDPIFDELGGIQLVTMMIRRSAFEALGGFDPTYRYAEDRDLFIRMREHGIAYAVLPELVLYKRLHGSNMTMNRPESHPLLWSLKEKLDRSRSEV